jgi:hypothetical protein
VPPQEIDRLLTGGAATAEPWGFASTGSGFNAFAEQTASAADTSSAFLPVPPTADSSAAATPRVGSGAARGGSGDWGSSGSGMPRAASPSGSSVGGAGWFGEQGGGGDAAGTRAIGVGTVLHTFVGDYNQPEELSVFDGDKVRAAVEAVGRPGGWRRLLAADQPLAHTIAIAPKAAITWGSTSWLNSSSA